MTSFILAFAYAVVFFLLVILGSRRDPRFLYILAFLIPLAALGIDLGVRLDWSKLAFPIAIVAFLLGKKRELNHRPVTRWVIAFLIYAIALTVIMAIVDYGGNRLFERGEILGWGPAQSTYRYWVQLFSFILVWGIVFVPVWFVRDRDDLSAVIRGFINGNLFSILIGFYQLLAIRFGLPGQDFNWYVAAGKGLFRDTGATRDLGFSVYRLTGLGGEPKHTASFAVCALILLLAIGLFSNDRYGIRFLPIKVIITFVAVLLTFSTGAWLALFTSISVLIILSLFYRNSTTSQKVMLIGGLFITVGILSQVEAAQELLQYRLLNRIETGVEQFEPKDAAFVAYLQDNPVEALTGAGAGGVDFRLIPYTSSLYLRQGATITPAYLYTRLLGDYGVVAIILLIGLWGNWMRQLSRSPDVAWGRFFMIGMVIGLAFGSAVSLSGYLFIGSALVAVASWQQSPAIVDRMYKRKLV